MITTVNPQWIAKRITRIELSTEAHPLIPQAQGINSGCFSPSSARPKGKGIPIKNPRGAISKIEMVIFIGLDQETKW